MKVHKERKTFIILAIISGLLLLLGIKENPEVEEVPNAEPDAEETADLPDKYGEILFQKIFSEKGFQYNVMYNAKGNWSMAGSEEYQTATGEL